VPSGNILQLAAGRHYPLVDLVKQPSRIVLLISVIVFVASLTQKGFSTAGEEPGSWSPGLYLLLIGPVGLMAGIFEWFANPFLLAAWIFSWFGKQKIALPLALIATGLIVAFLFRQTMIVSEAPTYAKITGYAAGYWLWLASAIIATVATLVGILAAKRPTNS
jgi:hypothetical protein